jgi:hypothetical protein
VCFRSLSAEGGRRWKAARGRPGSLCGIGVRRNNGNQSTSERAAESMPPSARCRSNPADWPVSAVSTARTARLHALRCRHGPKSGRWKKVGAICRVRECALCLRVWVPICSNCVCVWVCSSCRRVPDPIRCRRECCYSCRWKPVACLDSAPPAVFQVRVSRSEGPDGAGLIGLIGSSLRK